MPEFPDIELYLHALRPRIVGQRLEGARLASPFLVRSIEPPLDAAIGRTVRDVRRLGKRIVWDMGDEPVSLKLVSDARASEGGLFLVFHLMIAGRFQWKARSAPPSLAGSGSASFGAAGKRSLAAFDFSSGTLLMTEAGSKRRASLYVVRGEHALDAHDPGGIEVVGSTLEDFAAALKRENHTLKRALTDPHVLSGIGNAYSDEILHAAKLSPMKVTSRLAAEEIERLRATAIDTLLSWRDRLIAETGDNFPAKVTAFRESMAVHGRFGKPCPVCGTPVQRIRYADNEANYCPACQTGGKLLADRSLSRLMKGDWPKTLDELERKKGTSASVLRQD